MTDCDAVPELLSDEDPLTALHSAQVSMKGVLKVNCSDWHLDTPTEGQDMCASASAEGFKTDLASMTVARHCAVPLFKTLGTPV